MKKFLLILLLLVACAGTSSAFPFDKYTLDRKDLPEAAREMLDKYFPKAKIGMIKVDRHFLKKTDYDVRMVNGTTIEFKNLGKWSSVDCKNREVPEELIPGAIKRYVKKNFSELKINMIKKKSSGYEIRLSDDVELKFDLLGTFKGAVIDN